jgi:cell division protein FtsZ
MSMGISKELNSLDRKAVIKVCGVGGGGNNAVTRMIQAGLSDVEFIAINTDAQALRESPAGTRLQIGESGLGAGAKPEVAKQAALDDRDRIYEVLQGADMIFVTAGLGGGTGTGAVPVVASVARETGALTVGIVTLPFTFEGKERNRNAVQGLEELQEQVDASIIVPNDRLAELCHTNISFVDAFRQADEVLHNGVRSISELITMPGLINLDFADVRTIMLKSGRALMGIGTADGDDRAVRAAQEAIECPLLEDSGILGAMGVIVNVKGGRDITMREVLDAVTTVQNAAHEDANIIFGAVVDEGERPEVQVTVIAAGFTKALTQPVLAASAGDSREQAPATSAPLLDAVPEPVAAAEEGHEESESAERRFEETAVAGFPEETEVPGEEESSVGWAASGEPQEQFLPFEEDAVSREEFSRVEPFPTPARQEPAEDIDTPAYERAGASRLLERRGRIPRFMQRRKMKG